MSYNDNYISLKVYIDKTVRIIFIFNNISFQTTTEIQQYMRKTVSPNMESSQRIVEFQCHYHPASMPQESELLSTGRQWRCSIFFWWWFSGTCPCCCDSGISWRRPGRLVRWCHTTTMEWKLWTRTTSPSCPVWEPAKLGTLNKWTMWRALCVEQP